MTIVDWMMEHPWMTFFVGLSFANALGNLFRITVVNNKKDKENTNRN